MAIEIADENLQKDFLQKRKDVENSVPCSIIIENKSVVVVPKDSEKRYIFSKSDIKNLLVDLYR